MADYVDPAKLAAGGYKADEGKAPWGLLPYDAVGEIVKVLAAGAKKYKPRNWEVGMDWNRPYDALMRHMTAWWMGESKDPETGLPHLAHAGCCILFLLAYELRGVGKDNRPKTLAQHTADLRAAEANILTQQRDEVRTLIDRMRNASLAPFSPTAYDRS